MNRKKKVLIVEDNELNRSILKTILEEKYDVFEAANGQEGLDILKEHYEKISIVLLDVVMPVMDGYELLSIMKSDRSYSTIPVIIMTQGNSEEDEIEALSKGATDFLPKPYHAQIILHRVAGLIKLRETSAMANLYKYDRLTSFYSKDYFYEKVRTVLDENPDKSYIILCSNIENFKLYNDSYGREAGDLLLIKEANSLRKRVGDKAICGRYGADRFLLLLESGEDSKLRTQYGKPEENYQATDKIENMVVKYGVYRIDDSSLTIEQMCDRAIIAVESIKGIYNKQLAEYDDDTRYKMIREKEITDAMESSLEQGHFSVYFQPKYSLIDNSLIGSEALVRWVHPELGFLSPGDFIPLFEKNGFICKLDRFVWETVCHKLREWNEDGLLIVPVSVNVSRADIFQEDLPCILHDLVNKYHVNPKYLHLEITESAYTESPERIVEAIDDLRALGFPIEMDDFGSGFSSLNMLSRMSIDILKLDMGFIRSEMEKPIERRLLNDVVNMAHRMHLDVVAEGIETEDQRNRLRAIGCDYAQGYFYSKPLPEKEYEHVLMDCEEVISKANNSKGHTSRNGLYESNVDILKKLNDISESLPGGFFTYKADDTEEILSVNDELVKLFGCSCEEEFRKLTNNRFSGMVHPEDISIVKKDISAQITKANDTDHIKYRIICKDGSTKLVRDYGRFVHTDNFGDIYYVLIFDINR